MDERIQSLLRAWQSGQGPEAQRAYLLARLRAQDLTWLRIETAAYLGDEVAAGLLGEDAMVYVAPRTGLRDWVTYLPIIRSPDQLSRVEAIVLETLLASPPAGVRVSDDVRAAHEALKSGDRPEMSAAVERLVGVEDREERPTSLLSQSVRILAENVLTPRTRHYRPHLAILWAAEEDRPSILRVREAISHALLPTVLTDCAAPEEDWLPPRGHADSPALRSALAAERADRIATDGHQLHVLVVDSTPARAVLEAVRPADDLVKPAPDLAQDLFRAYCEALGWTRKRVNYVAPNEAKRLRLKKRSLSIEIRREGSWAKKWTWTQRSANLVDSAQRLLAACRAAV